MLRWRSAARARCRCGGCCPRQCSTRVGRLDQSAIARVREEARPDVRDADELHDALQTLVALPEELARSGMAGRGCALASASLPELLEGWRVVRATAGDRRYVVASERAKEFALIYPDAKFEVTPPELAVERRFAGRCSAGDDQGLDDALGPDQRGGAGLSARLPTSDIAKLCCGWRQAVRRCAETSPAKPRAANLRRPNGAIGGLLARIHHLTVATLRKQVEPVTAAQFMRWLLRWQHVAPNAQASRRAWTAGGDPAIAGL